MKHRDQPEQHPVHPVHPTLPAQPPKAEPPKDQPDAPLSTKEPPIKPAQPHESAPIAGSVPAPRMISQNERAPEGLTRYKIRVQGPESVCGTRYLLSATQEDAIAHYRKLFRLPASDFEVLEDGKPGKRILTWVITKLPD